MNSDPGRDAYTVFKISGSMVDLGESSVVKESTALVAYGSSIHSFVGMWYANVVPPEY